MIDEIAEAATIAPTQPTPPTPPEQPAVPLQSVPHVKPKWHMASPRLANIAIEVHNDIVIEVKVSKMSRGSLYPDHLRMVMRALAVLATHHLEIAE